MYTTPLRYVQILFSFSYFFTLDGTRLAIAALAYLLSAEVLAYSRSISMIVCPINIIYPIFE